MTSNAYTVRTWYSIASVLVAFIVTLISGWTDGSAISEMLPLNSTPQKVYLMYRNYHGATVVKFSGPIPPPKYHGTDTFDQGWVYPLYRVGYAYTEMKEGCNFARRSVRSSRVSMNLSAREIRTDLEKLYSTDAPLLVSLIRFTHSSNNKS